ncbi:hypothetical protein ACFUIY_04720 [Streptomyces griseorubiginosus]|uniref:hypothetical protein n=1 Tax=Streptomyces griseorubiginosus TaxID=67304 RepID=UPI00113FFF87|nr:hypothetical protein [Streptomyces griseorubiginosus]
MRTLSLPLALTARISPVVVLAAAGWVLTSGPAATPAPQKESAPQSADQPSSDGGSSAAAATTKRYSAAPAPCGSIGAATIKSLVPGAKTAGKEIPSTDPSLRRTCSWNALKGYDYRWLDVSFEITDSQAEAAKSYKENITAKSGGGTVPGVGDAGYSVVNLTTEDKQQTREGVVMIQASNALVTVTYNGSDFESKKAPATDEINKGAIKAAKEAVAALESGQKA